LQGFAAQAAGQVGLPLFILNQIKANLRLLGLSHVSLRHSERLYRALTQELHQ
jgi:hypothetical protein